jgi:hypothetical protein
MSQLNFLHCTNNAKKVIVLLRSHCGKLVLPLKHIYRNIHYHHNLVHIKQYMRSFVNTYKTVGGSDKLGDNVPDLNVYQLISKVKLTEEQRNHIPDFLFAH